MGIHGIILLSCVQAGMSQRRRNNKRRIVESQNVSLCSPNPDSKAAKKKPKDIGLKHLLGHDLKKATKNDKTYNDIFIK